MSVTGSVGAYARAINRFIASTHPNAPLAGQGALIARIALQEGVNPLPLTAIFRKESEYGTTSGKYKFNPGGWGVKLGPSVYTSRNWEEGIRKIARGLAGSLYRGAGRTTAETILPLYAPASENDTATYINQVNQWIREMGGDPNRSWFDVPSLPGAQGEVAIGADSPDVAMAAGGGVSPASLLMAIRQLRGGGSNEPAGGLRRVSILHQLMNAQQPAMDLALPAAADDGHDHGHSHGGAPGVYSGDLASRPPAPVDFAAAPDYKWAQELANRFGLRVTSTFRDPGQNASVGGSSTSRHMVRGGAADFAGSPEAMRRLAEWAIRSGRYAEVFYDPIGIFWDNGRINRGQIGGHSDHVHISFGAPRR